MCNGFELGVVVQGAGKQRSELRSIGWLRPEPCVAVYAEHCPSLATFTELEDPELRLPVHDF